MRRLICAGLTILVPLLAACVSQPKIDTSSFQAPQTIVLVAIPRIKYVAVVGGVQPAFPDVYFSAKSDFYFDVGSGTGPRIPDATAEGAAIAQRQLDTLPPKNYPGAAQATASVAAGALVGAFIEDAARSTAERSQRFDEEVRSRLPSFDLTADFMNALRLAIESRGAKVQELQDFRSSPLRFIWPAKTEAGENLPTYDGKVLNAVDADLLVQVCPFAFYGAPGQLNAYYPNVGVGIALYDGRTRRFIGRQVVWKSYFSMSGHHQYDALVNDIPNLMPVLRDALLAQVPLVADVVTGRRSSP